MTTPCGPKGRCQVSEFQPRSPCCREAYPDDPDRLCKSCQDYRGYRHDVLHSEVEPYHAPPGFAHMPYWQVKGLAPPDWSKKKRKKGDDLEPE